VQVVGDAMYRTRPPRALIALAALIAGCVSTQPDVGQYSSTATSAAPDQAFRLPRDRKLLVASVPGQPACAAELLSERLHSLAVAVEWPRDRIDVDLLSRHQRGAALTADEAAVGLDEAIVLAVFVDALEGPGGGWRPMATMDLKSPHHRSDVGLAVYDGRSRAILWSSKVRARRVLQCDDEELLSMIHTIVSRVE
jgi:hypothetical protein